MLPPDATLVVIDVQKGFDDPFWGPRNNPHAEANIAKLIAAWRSAERPIRHVLHSSRSPAGTFFLGTAGHDPKPEAAPRPGEPVHVKKVNSAFIGTSLEQDLRDAGVNTLVVVGLTTNHCVSTTVRMAGNFGFDVFLVENATATFDRVGLDGKLRLAAEVHAAALSDLSEEFATIVSTDDILQRLHASEPRAVA